jgi:hypothetical protein
MNVFDFRALTARLMPHCMIFAKWKAVRKAQLGLNKEEAGDAKA